MAEQKLGDWGGGVVDDMTGKVGSLHSAGANYFFRRLQGFTPAGVAASRVPALPLRSWGLLVPSTMCDGALLPPLVLSLLLLVWGLDPGTAVGDAAADVEVVLPRRLHPDDVHLQLLPGVAGLRRWRRPRASPSGPRAGTGERALLLHLPAFGRDLYLQLRRDLRFLSPGFEVEEAGAAGSSEHPAELCFYSGRVLGHRGSLVSLSACGASGGLVGLIQLKQEQVFIQPLNNSGGPFSGREHLIRRKWSSAPQSVC
ncbi:A disintegrin and metalloproteinase with thrombospondin motifs 17-like [Phodopus roborovskii]|uniref:A disintegrin and metalloproteinase with thrombospondin motifs 17-like n=1 Tax=Phodopus roborovskii TaxID=109678 RepID=UPI0021E4EB17|nr:A disintegrin and metalloproteinase with thrombospondin motifs 17-like [Phodopus roborovskii]